MKKIAILSIFILFTFLFSCNNNDIADKNYEDFNHIDHWDEFQTFEDDVIAVYYSPFCEICQSIEDEVTEYMVILEAEYSVYVIHGGMIFEQGEPPYKNIETPSVIVYKNGEFIDLISGSKPIINYLSSLIDD
ncbi:MAG: hypothetical protein R6U15_04715 [Candidatus Izemoplasmatales bacterium]